MARAGRDATVELNDHHDERIVADHSGVVADAPAPVGGRFGVVAEMHLAGPGAHPRPGERHPLAEWWPAMPLNDVLLYSPRSEAEAEAVGRIVQAAERYARG